MEAPAAGFRRSWEGHRLTAAGPARCILAMIVLGLFSTLAGPAPARAADKAAIRPAPSDRYLAVKDVNLRSKPTTRSAKAGKLKKGQKVEALGITKDGWLKVKEGKGGNNFVYNSYLVPLIDGSLKDDLAGKVSRTKGASCAYTIHFIGNSAVPDEIFDTSDYDVGWRCRYHGKDISFAAFMFITEAPYTMSTNRIYQINLDVREVGNSVEGAFSTIVLYNAKKKRVVLDTVTLAEYAQPSPTRERPAANVSEALTGATELAFGAWNARLWAALAAGH
ncbi:MAG: SH3 domain-containing protein [Rhodospirillales bacterium]|nr:SH3 domain-containing protein [Rhodospirillales bacterium]MDP6885072.1 SH3 domain-containing protein [Rhodospirillales bacterium]